MAAKSKNFDQVYQKNFATLKSQQAFVEDASRKSSIDARIRDLVEAINESANYFTTSSCSGRLLAFSQDENFVKKNCEWIRVTHEPLSDEEIEDFINAIEEKRPENKQINLKFEPFILHVCCRSLIDAKLMLEQSIASGFRNSGISLGACKIILAVRSTQNLECPISHEGQLIVDHNFIRFICKQANNKFNDNFQRIEKFFKNIREKCLNRTNELREEKTSNVNRERTTSMKEKKSHHDETKDDGEYEQNFDHLFS